MQKEQGSDPEAIKDAVNRFPAGQGIQGLVCNGHTGEITGLTRAERKRIVEICAEKCGDIMIFRKQEWN